jgi:hypothetical protein
MKKLVHDGVTYYSVSNAARYLSTTNDKVRGMMGDGSLQWAQFKENGKLYITATSLVAKQKALLDSRVAR